MTNSWSWRIPSILQSIPSVYQLLLVHFVPESPRWLISKGRRHDAKRILNRYHAGIENDSETSALVEYELAEIETAIELEKEQNTESYLDFFATSESFLLSAETSSALEPQPPVQNTDLYT